MRSVKYIFENKSWWLILLIGLACVIVPIVGMMVFIGYMAMHVIEFHKTKQDKLVNFDFNLLGDYLNHGIWVFLAMIIPGFLYMFVVFGVIFGVIGLSITADNSAIGPAMGLIFIPIHFISIVLLNFLIVPFSIGAAYGKSLKAAFNKDFIFDFMGKMWVDLIIVLLFAWLVGACAAIAGLLLCCVGTYLAVPFMFMVQWHLYWQLYEEYLKRGGKAVV